jgi:hypothetical protein
LAKYEQNHNIVPRSSFRHDDDDGDDDVQVGGRKQVNGARGTISPLTDHDFDGHGKSFFSRKTKKLL